VYNLYGETMISLLISEDEPFSLYSNIIHEFSFDTISHSRRISQMNILSVLTMNIYHTNYQLNRIKLADKLRKQR